MLPYAPDVLARSDSRSFFEIAEEGSTGAETAKAGQCIQRIFGRLILVDQTFELGYAVVRPSLL